MRKRRERGGGEREVTFVASLLFLDLDGGNIQPPFLVRLSLFLHGAMVGVSFFFFFFFTFTNK